jgi:hypothetical protein
VQSFWKAISNFTILNTVKALSCEGDPLFFWAVSLSGLSVAHGFFELSDFPELFVDDPVYFLHEVLSVAFGGLSVVEGHLVKGHDFHGEVGDWLEEVLAQRIGKLSLGCSLHLYHILGVRDLVLEDDDDGMVLGVDLHQVVGGLSLYGVLVAFLVGQSACWGEYLRQGKKAFLRRFRWYTPAIF